MPPRYGKVDQGDNHAIVPRRNILFAAPPFHATLSSVTRLPLCLAAVANASVAAADLDRLAAPADRRILVQIVMSPVGSNGTGFEEEEEEEEELTAPLLRVTTDGWVRGCVYFIRAAIVTAPMLPPCEPTTGKRDYKLAIG